MTDMKRLMNEKLLKREIEKESKELTKRDLEEYYITNMTTDYSEKEKKEERTIWMALSILMTVVCIIGTCGMYIQYEHTERTADSIAAKLCDTHNQGYEYRLRTRDTEIVRCSKEKIEIPTIGK